VQNLPVKRKIASRESGKYQFFARGSSLAVTAAMARTATSGQRNAIYAKLLAGDLQHVETAAAFARGIIAGQTSGCIVKWLHR